MLRPSKKISKRELKQDALITTYVQATTFYNEHKRIISIGITALVVVVAGLFIYFRNRSENSEHAITELAAVYHFYDNGQYQIAVDGVPERNIAGLKSIVDNYGNSPGGDLARFYLANAYFQLGNYDDALKQFEDFSGNYELLAVSRLAGIAACYEAKGMHREAAEYFERAGTKDAKDLGAAENLDAAARNYALAGEKEKAIELYRKLKKSYPTSSFAREADRYIAQLSV